MYASHWVNITEITVKFFVMYFRVFCSRMGEQFSLNVFSVTSDFNNNFLHNEQKDNYMGIPSCVGSVVLCDCDDFGKLNKDPSGKDFMSL